MASPRAAQPWNEKRKGAHHPRLMCSIGVRGLGGSSPASLSQVCAALGVSAPPLRVTSGACEGLAPGLRSPTTPTAGRPRLLQPFPVETSVGPCHATGKLPPEARGLIRVLVHVDCQLPSGRRSLPALQSFRARFGCA